MRRFSLIQIPSAVLVCLAVIANGGSASAQNNGGNNNNNIGGISIDADGVVRRAESLPQSERLRREQMEAFAAENLSGDMQAYSDLRKVSLVKLEQAYAEVMDAGEDVSEEMLHLAGLQRIDYVFIDTDARDIVVAGPAEGFAPDDQARMVGLTTGRPAIRLDDLIVALRSVLQERQAIRISIDPDEDRLAALQEYVRRNSSATSTAGAQRRYRQMGQILGLENVTIDGIPRDSHFARSLVEADYLMKRISLGAESSGVRGIRSHLSLLAPNGNSMQRWWFVPFYEGIYASDDGNAYEIVGQRAQLMAQEEWVDAQGARSNAAFTRASTEQYAVLFTEHFEELAEVSPVFAEMQNLFDLAVVAALIDTNGAMRRVGWRADVFLDQQRAPIASFDVPRQVPSEAMTRPARRGVMLGLIGGVTLSPWDVVQKFESHGGEEGARVAGVRARSFGRPESDEIVWWWD
jgi:hypothetical protein